MRRTYLVIILFFLSVQIAHAQKTNRNQISSAPATTQFEIIQSELTAKGTYMIDKYTGSVYQMVQGDKGLFWQKIFAELHSNDKINEGKVNYQLFTSGLAIRMTYLINVNTGATWELAEDEEIGLFWGALE